MKTLALSIPLTEEEVRSADIGDVVFLTGLVYTCRARFHMRVIDEGIVPPIDFSKFNVMVHTGIEMRRGPEGQWIPIGHEGLSIPGTASNRFEAYGPAIIQRLGIRAIVGKGAMGKETMKAMQRLGCIHLTTNFKRSGRGGVEMAVDVYGFDELGTVEATWVFEVADWGPFVVSMDTKGRNLFDEVDRQAREKLLQIVYPHFGIPKDFRYTMDLPG